MKKVTDRSLYAALCSVFAIAVFASIGCATPMPTSTDEQELGGFCPNFPPVRCQANHTEEVDQRCALLCRAQGGDSAYCPELTDSEANTCRAACTAAGYTGSGWNACVEQCFDRVMHNCTAGEPP